MDKHFRENIVLLFLLGVLAINYPILALFDHGVLLFGIPLLYLYLFSIWGLLIGLLAWLMERPRSHTDGEE